MAVHINVFLERSKLPTFAAWSAAIASEGFPLAFPEAVNLARHTGYIPALFQGEESGFEFFLSEITNREEEVPDEIQTQLPNVSAIADFRFHEMHECLAASVAAAVLAKLSGGAYSDPQEDGRNLFGEQAIIEARRELEEEEKKAARHSEKLSPARWVQVFEEQLREVHPDYHLNPSFRGRAVECTREHSGLVLSQNCVRMHDSYQHCFAILFSRRKLNGALFNPFTIGSRFDHNSTIPSAYREEYRAANQRPAPAIDIYREYGCTERRARQGVKETARFAEEYFVPIYLNRLAGGAERLAGLFRDAIDFIEKWGVTEESLRVPVTVGGLAEAFARELRLDIPPEDWYDYVVTKFNALRLADANGLSVDRLLAHRRDSINTRCDDVLTPSKRYLSLPDDIRSAAIFTAYVDDFLALKSELPEIIDAIEKLPETNPPAPMHREAPA